PCEALQGSLACRRLFQTLADLAPRPPSSDRHQNQAKHKHGGKNHEQQYADVRVLGFPSKEVGGGCPPTSPPGPGQQCAGHREPMSCKEIQQVCCSSRFW